MASEALQNQVLLDQMFARSMAPINQSLEIQRQRIQQQQDWERTIAQREKELAMEQTFRAQQSREHLAAQAELARQQQDAIGAREIAAEGRATAKATLEKIDASPFLTKEEKAEAHKDPAKAEKYAAEISNRAVDEDMKSVRAIHQQGEETMKAAVYAMATEARRLPPDVVNRVNNTWLNNLSDKKVQRVLYSVLRRDGTLTPATVDRALQEARGMFGMGVAGLSDDAIMQASIQYHTALSEAAGMAKDANPEVQRLVAKYQALQDQAKSLVATPTGRLAANRFVQEMQEKSDATRAKYEEKMKAESVAPSESYPVQTPQGWEQGAGITPTPAGGTPQIPAASPTQMGGIIGGVRNVAQAAPGFLSNLGTSAYNAVNAVTDFEAGVVGGDYLRNQVQANRRQGEAALKAMLADYAAQQEALRQSQLAQPGYGATWVPALPR